MLLISGCATSRKVRTLQISEPRASISLPREQDFIPDISKDMTARRDTFVIRDGDKGIIIMKAIKDEDGEMVAHDVIDAAVVTARFRNVAERHGKVDIEFQIIGRDHSIRYPHARWHPPHLHPRWLRDL